MAGNGEEKGGHQGHHHGHHHGHDAPDFDHMSEFLLSDERRKWQNPERIAEAIRLPEKGVIVDIGCGPGFFTLPLASRSGGMVVGIDARIKLLTLCRMRLESAGVRNAELVQMELDDAIPISDGSVDFILMANVLHDLTQPEKVMLEAARILRKGGRVVDLDWKKEEGEFGPPIEIRFSRELSGRIMADAGFSVSEIEGIGQYHYCLLGVKD